MVGGTDFSGFWLVGSTDGVAGPESARAALSADSLATADYQGGGVDSGAQGGRPQLLGGEVGGGGNDSLPTLHRVEGAE